MAKETKETKKKKRPTAEKRMIQNKKRRLENKAFKTGVRTSIRRFEEALKGGDVAAAQESLNNVYGMMDQGVKRGIFKMNKAGRTKSRLTARFAAQKS